jgi:hypothetical protein
MSNVKAELSIEETQAAAAAEAAKAAQAQSGANTATGNVTAQVAVPSTPVDPASIYQTRLLEVGKAIAQLTNHDEIEAAIKRARALGSTRARSILTEAFGTAKDGSLVEMMLGAEYWEHAQNNNGARKAYWNHKLIAHKSLYLSSGLGGYSKLGQKTPEMQRFEAAFTKIFTATDGVVVNPAAGFEALALAFSDAVIVKGANLGDSLDGVKLF